MILSAEVAGLESIRHARLGECVPRHDPAAP